MHYENRLQLLWFIRNFNISSAICKHRKINCTLLVLPSQFYSDLDFEKFPISFFVLFIILFHLRILFWLDFRSLIVEKTVCKKQLMKWGYIVLPQSVRNRSAVEIELWLAKHGYALPVAVMILKSSFNLQHSRFFNDLSHCKVRKNCIPHQQIGASLVIILPGNSVLLTACPNQGSSF